MAFLLHHLVEPYLFTASNLLHQRGTIVGRHLLCGDFLYDFDIARVGSTHAMCVGKVAGSVILRPARMAGNPVPLTVQIRWVTYMLQRATRINNCCYPERGRAEASVAEFDSARG